MLSLSSYRRERTVLARLPAVFTALCLLVVFGGCEGITEGTDGEPNFSVEMATETLDTGFVEIEGIDRGQYGDIVEGTQTVLRDEEAYAGFWERLHADQRSVPERPDVNFEEKVVVAIVLGQRSTGGYSVKIDEALASDEGNQIQIQFTETVPGSSCIVTQALTSPYVLATVEARDADVTFTGSEMTRSC